MAKLYFYYAAMNAGKSTMLLQASYNYQERGMTPLLFTQKGTVRFGKVGIHSRIGLAQDAVLFTEDFNFFAYVQKAQKNIEKLACILLDEAQFLTKEQVIQLVNITKKLNLPVLCYGLRSDFLGEPFRGSIYLLTWADRLMELKTMCKCGQKATMNIRIDAMGVAVKQGEQIHIGGCDQYISVCLGHFNEMVGLDSI